MTPTLPLVALFFALGGLAPLIRCDHWLIRGWDFPRVQLLFIDAALLVVLLAAGIYGEPWEVAVLVALAVSMGYLAWSMRRYLPFYPVEAQPTDAPSALKVMVSNVLMSNRESDKLVAAVREAKPDLLVALETDEWWREKIAALEDLLPHAVEVPQDDTYGMIVRSRLPLIEPSVSRLFRPNIPSVHCRIELPDGAEMHVHAVHPKPPFPDESKQSTSRDAELLLVGKAVKKCGGPTIVLGDLNDVAWSRSTRIFQRVSGLLDPRIGRGFFSTYHAEHWWMRWPLDHVFISDHFRIRSLRRLESVGSDHFPIFADFSYEPQHRLEQPEPRADAEDNAEADEKIREGHESRDD